MHHFAASSPSLRSKQIPPLALAEFLSGCLWQVFYGEERCCCRCPINDSMRRIRWKAETERKMSLPGCSGGNFRYIIHRVVWRIWVLMWWMLFESGGNSVFLNPGFLSTLSMNCGAKCMHLSVMIIWSRILCYLRTAEEHSQHTKKHDGMMMRVVSHSHFHTTIIDNWLPHLTKQHSRLCTVTLH